MSISSPSTARAPCPRLTLVSLLTGMLGVVVLALPMNSALAAFTASITNSVNTAAAR